MSDEKKVGRGPAPSYSFSQFKKMMEFARELLSDSPLVKYSILAAGVGGALEGLRILWLAARYLLRF